MWKILTGKAVVTMAIAMGCAAQSSDRSAQQGEAEIRSWRKAGPPEKSVDVLFVGDGYTRAQKAKFRRDVDRYSTRLLKEPPLSWYKKKFNIRSAFVPSQDRGCDVSPSEDKVDTLLESYFGSQTGRRLMFRNHRALRKIVAQAEHVDIAFVMVDTERYGGAGTVLPSVRVRGRPLAAPTFAAQDTASFLIAIHELGHSFADLADEYVDRSLMESFEMPRAGEDLAQANVTLAGQFDDSSTAALKKTIKWKHFLALGGANRKKWLHEGGYYREKGVFRPWRDCMMRTTGVRFCPVCTEEVAKAIVATCGEKWDGRAYHKKHPLRLW